MFDDTAVVCDATCVIKPRRKGLSPKARRNIPRAPFTSRSIPKPFSSRITLAPPNLVFTAPSQLRVLLVYASVPRQLYLPICRQLVLPIDLLLLAALLGRAGAVAGDVKLQDDGVMDHPVNRRGGGHGVGEDALPLREDQV